jgi:hypothetical protein
MSTNISAKETASPQTGPQKHNMAIFFKNSCNNSDSVSVIYGDDLLK